MIERTIKGQAATRGLDAGVRQDWSIPAILEALTFVPHGAMPEQALEAALAAREELMPRLIEELSLAPLDVAVRYGAAPDGTTYYLHELAMHLLAAWRDPAGWRLIIDFFMSDCDLAIELSDFGLEAYLPAMLVRTYDGSELTSLERLIATDRLDPIFRQVLVQAYHGLVATGQAPRARLINFLAEQLAAPADATADGWWDWLALRSAEVPHGKSSPCRAQRSLYSHGARSGPIAARRLR